jgi:hypothetical protein
MRLRPATATLGKAKDHQSRRRAGRKVESMPKKTSQKRRTRIVRSMSELTEDEMFCARSMEVRQRQHPDGRVETLRIKLTLCSERDAAKLLRMRDALKAAGHWPSNSGGAN